MQDNKTNVISLEQAAGRRIVLDTESKKLVTEIGEITSRQLQHSLADLFEGVDDALYQMADRAENNTQQTLYFDAMRQVRKERNRMETAFMRRFARTYEVFWDTLPTVVAVKKPGESLEMGGLSLMEEGELEETLAGNSMASKGENLFQQELTALGQRLTQVAKGREVNNQNNPLAPASIAQHFIEAARPLEVNIKVKLVFFKLFEKHVLEQLGEVYDLANDRLVQAGILPKIPSVSNKRVKSSHSPSRKVAPGREGTAAAEEESNPHLDAEAFGALQQLLNLARAASGAQVVVAPAGMTFQQADVVQTLSQLQIQGNAPPMISGPGGEFSSADFKQHITQQIRQVRGNDHVLGQAESDTIDFIGMMFEFMLEDRNLPDAMRALIGRLQIPMLKVGMLDKSFFSKKTHPARRLLNALAQAGMGWTDDGDRGERSFYAKIESIVNRIMNDFTDNMDLFANLLEELQLYLEGEKRGQEILEKRANQVNEGKEQLKLAKQRAGKEISVRLQGKEVPEVMLRLLQEAWKDVLLLIHLRQGVESADWQHAVQLMDDILWSVQPKSTPEDKQRLLTLMPQVLKQVRDGLASISYDPHKMAKIFKELQTCHMYALRASEDNAPPPPPAVVAKPADVPPVVASTPAAAVLRERDDYDRQAEAMAVGQWIEYTEAGQTQRAKLSWKSKVDGNCVFVNRRGLKVLEKSVMELAALLRTSRLTLIEEVPLMDRALSAMMGSLRRHTESADKPAQPAS